MLIIVVSDSHGRTERLNEILERYPQADFYIHCGDVLIPKKEYPQFISVQGNNDPKGSYPEEFTLDIGQHRLLILHGHQFPSSKREQRMVKKAKSLGADIVCFGHTHKVQVTSIDSVWLVNPGALWRCKGNKGASYAVLTLEEEIHIEIHYFNEEKG